MDIKYTILIYILYFILAFSLFFNAFNHKLLDDFDKAMTVFIAAFIICFIFVEFFFHKNVPEFVKGFIIGGASVVLSINMVTFIAPTVAKVLTSN